MSTNTVGQHALSIAFVVSSVFIAISALVLFTNEYKRRNFIIEGEIEHLRSAQVSGIVEGLWNYDDTLLKALVDGFSFNPYINYAVIRNEDGEIASSGSSKSGNEGRSFPLVRKVSTGVEERLGTLYLEIDSHRILSDTIEQVLISLSFQVLFLVVESFIVLLLFSRMVTRHLSRIAAYIKDVGLQLSAPPLSLEKVDRGDELDVLVRSFNGMRQNLADSREAELRAMEELRMSEERNRVLVEEAPDAIMMHDADLGKLILCNRQAEILFGRRREEILLLAPVDLYMDEQPDGLPVDQSASANIARAIAGGSRPRAA